MPDKSKMQAKAAKVMREHSKGKLKSGGGEKAKSANQAKGRKAGAY